jgi:hypothetical protein
MEVLMGLLDNGITKSRAVASDARADLAEVNSRLVLAEAWQGLTGAGDAAARSLGSSRIARPNVIAPIVEVITTQSTALHSRAVANVDELRLRRQAAQSRLTVAEKSGAAMARLAEETDKLIGD